ncbi:glutaredoxin family protein [Spirochaetia bacterium 38H-sp]|uniref:Glutaredoxin family protein n=1 Tax=Rarispira pelagica TaxID=3141764 RepID=A0ABU9U8J8_9SPIR
MEEIKMQKTEGSRKAPFKLTLYSLSTCGFCRRAKKFLEENGFPFDWLDVDTLDKETRTVLKDELKSRFSVKVGFPFLAIEHDSGKLQALVGFIERDWEDILL